MAFYCFLPGPDDLHDFRPVPLGGRGPSTPPPPLPEHPDPCIEDESQGGQYVPDPDLKKLQIQFDIWPSCGIIYLDVISGSKAPALSERRGFHDYWPAMLLRSGYPSARCFRSSRGPISWKN